MISEGKDRLEWYRQVDPAKLNTLKELIAAPDYKVNHELVKIHQIYPNTTLQRFLKLCLKIFVLQSFINLNLK